VQVLKAKQGSSQQYSSQAERDTHLKKHIKQLKQAAAGQEDQLQSLRSQEEELGTALNDLASVSTRQQLSVHQGPWSVQAAVEQWLL
jgi:DNA repair exonuclease SbcCD ATPase subunit